MFGKKMEIFSTNSERNVKKKKVNNLLNLD